MKEFIYFFKHIGIDGIKIGRTSGDDISSRFASFKTYSPNGAEVIGYYETINSTIEEKRLHSKYDKYRMNGEFFNISIQDVQNELRTQNVDYDIIVCKIKEFINEGYSMNDIHNAIELFKNKSNSIINKNQSRLEIVLNNLPEKFSRADALSVCNNLKFPSRFFESSTRTKEFDRLVKSAGHGRYIKL